ncbi:uncharacterized protein EKO05_0002552 [Ascochyta rabiei]|uniref:Chromatin binding n=1 Tax=Didymella rabiei TaxID=5454 RepID=A0A163IMY2_DIDRA|nr:uncharacterized protein EKO05_0002552 [Ascochyta rabiei]KZM25825.1 chromatin binding [Ascochyta rabiei]UPX11973.1 hypothetical protein EKO05_0002552 [Ascochyta rabiei]
MKSPRPTHNYRRTQESPISSHHIDNLPATGWYDSAVTNSDYQYTYEHYLAPRSSVALSSPTPAFSQAAQVPSSVTHTETSVRKISPLRGYPQRSSLSGLVQQSVELPPASEATSQQSPTRLKVESHDQESSHGSFSVLQSVPGMSSWAVDSLGIHTPTLQTNSYYANFAQHIRGPRTGETTAELLLNAPQPRRVFTPIAPQPIDTPRSMAAKRSRDDDEIVELSKRRRRSESTTSTQLELTEEDKLLLKLKEEESMPWKEIAARFQQDLGKQYQIPALQMRLKRLRERMRVWSDVDVRALRMAHEYWAHNKFDIVSEKMLEFGAQEKWTARQCARKWAESDAMPTPVPQYDQHPQHTFTPYSMSPSEPATSFLPYMHS